MAFIKAQSVTNLDELRTALQNAIELEHATIPTYLVAYYSLRPGTNREIAAVLRSIIIEEMQHMTLAANILNAVGGAPSIDAPSFVPTYPGPLPMHIGDEPGRPLIVPLARFSKELVKAIFMIIEKPEDPLHFHTRKAALAAMPDKYQTIGQFYEAIRGQIVESGEGIFTGDASKQVTGVFGLPDDVLRITDVASASRAIDRIVKQGEGTPVSPETGMNELAHYYKFEEISKGHRLVRDPTTGTWEWDPSKPIPFDPAGVWPLHDKPKIDNYPEGSLSRRLALQYNASYTELLRALHVAFNGKPQTLHDALGLMYSLTVEANAMTSVPVPGTDFTTAPTFELEPAPRRA